MASTTPSTPAFGFANLGHWFSAGITAVKAGLRYVENKALPAVQKTVEAAEAPTAVLAAAGVPDASEALLFERAIDSAAGQLLAAIHTADNIDPNAPTVDIKIGIDTYNQFKQFIAAQKVNLAALGFKL